MNEQDMHEARGERLLSRVDRQNNTMRVFEVVILGALVLFNLYVGLRLQSIINLNQTSTVEARKVNIQRQNQTQSYIKCVYLVAYNVPRSSLGNRQEAEKALDECATQQTAK